MFWCDSYIEVAKDYLNKYMVYTHIAASLSFIIICLLTAFMKWVN